MREMQVGDKALVLLPTAESKLLMQWKGPFEVVERVGPTDYRIRIGGVEKVYHINMLKKYYESSSKRLSASQTLKGGNEVIAAAVVEEEADDDVPGNSLSDAESIDDVHISGDCENSFMSLETYSLASPVRQT